MQKQYSVINHVILNGALSERVFMWELESSDVRFVASDLTASRRGSNMTGNDPGCVFTIKLDQSEQPADKNKGERINLGGGLCETVKLVYSRRCQFL